MRTLSLALAAVLAVARAGLAQDTTTTPAAPAPAPAPAAAAPTPPAPQQANSAAISPGMTEADVRARWGNPAIVRTQGQWKYLFYRNHMERSVGWLDVVFLQNGQVVDCIARGDGHLYTGESSSPPDRIPERSLPDKPARDSATAAVTGVRVNP